MNKNASVTLVFLIMYILFAIIAMGFGSAAFDFLRGPRPGGWWSILLGSIAFLLGVHHTKSYRNDCLRISWIVVGTFAVIIIIIAGLVDAATSGVLRRSDSCFAYDSDLSAKSCCRASNNDSPFSAMLSCAVPEKDGENTCVCCTFDGHDDDREDDLVLASKWKVNGDCKDLRTKAPRLLSGASAFNFLSAVWMLIALFISCCKCCGPRDGDMQPTYATGTVIASSVVTANNLSGPVVTAAPAN